MTADAGLLVADDRTTAEQLYTGMSRGRQMNRVLVVAEVIDPDHGQHRLREPIEMLKDALQRSGADRAAHEVRRDPYLQIDHPHFRAEVAAEARSQVDLLAGADRRREIEVLERGASVDAAREKFEEARVWLESETAGRERAEQELAGAIGAIARERAAAQLAQARRYEDYALRGVEQARHELYEAEERSERLDVLQEEQVARELWLGRHPDEAAWLAEFDPKTLSRDDLRRILADPALSPLLSKSELAEIAAGDATIEVEGLAAEPDATRTGGHRHPSPEDEWMEYDGSDEVRATPELQAMIAPPDINPTGPVIMPSGLRSALSRNKHQLASPGSKPSAARMNAPVVALTSTRK